MATTVKPPAKSPSKKMMETSYPDTKDVKIAPITRMADNTAKTIAGQVSLAVFSSWWLKYSSHQMMAVAIK